MMYNDLCSLQLMALVMRLTAEDCPHANDGKWCVPQQDLSMSWFASSDEDMQYMKKSQSMSKSKNVCPWRHHILTHHHRRRLAAATAHPLTKQISGQQRHTGHTTAKRRKKKS
jgi:hypothetical protein